MSITDNTEYDVVIIGGGMVGASLACALQTHANGLDLKVLVVEASAIPTNTSPAQPSFDARTTVLSPSSVEYFSELGLWSELASVSAKIQNIHVSDQGHFGAVRLSSEEYGTDALGYVVENRLLGQVLNGALHSADNLELLTATKVIGIQPKPQGVAVTIEHQKAQNGSFIVNAKLAVLVEGGRSGLCQKLGIHRHVSKYQQSAIIANIAFANPHKNVAYERFTAKGPLAVLPLNDLNGEKRAAIVWTHAANNVDAILALNDQDFLAALQKDFGSKLGELTKVGHRASYALSLEQAEEQIRPGIVLLGNVANALHPVAGQGFNLAFRNSMHLAQGILDALHEGNDPGSIKALSAYMEKIESDQDKTIAFSHYMTKIFSSNAALLTLARKFGLLSVDLVPSLKQELIKQAMGKGTPKAYFGTRA